MLINDTYESEKEVGQFVFWVGKFDIDEFFGNTFCRSKDAPTFECANLIDEADSLLGSLADGKVFLVVTDSHSCHALRPINT